MFIYKAKARQGKGAGDMDKVVKPIHRYTGQRNEATYEPMFDRIV